MKGAIFDIDGTLLDSMGIWEEIGQRYLKTLGICAEAHLSEIMFSMSMEEAADYLKEHYYIEKEPIQIKEEILKMIAQFYYTEVKLKLGVKNILERLQEKNIPMVLATSGDETLALVALKRLGIDHYFSRMFTCTMLNTTKREPLIYEEAITYLDVLPNEVWVFEDVLHALQTAKTLRCVTVGVEDCASEKQKIQIMREADYYIQDFIELESVIQEILNRGK